MQRKRVYIPPEEIDNKNIIVKDDEFHYLKNVLRVRTGEDVEIFDGKGRVCKSIVKDKKSDNIVLEPKEDIKGINKLPVFISLAQAATRSKTMDIIIEKAAELGVREIIPFISSGAREEIKEKFSEKRKRWERICKESVRLCGGAFIPEIKDFLSFKECLDIKPLELNILLWEEEKITALKDVLNKNKGVKSIRVFIGPEAGFDIKEIEAVKDRGIITASLGPMRLRAETAAISALALIVSQFTC
jgi:16S rRNA (uracil1498-N3)-methyltransferase